MNNQTSHKTEAVEDKSTQDFLKERLISVFEKYNHLLPEEKKPTILVCGKMGVGKTIVAPDFRTGV